VRGAAPAVLWFSPWVEKAGCQASRVSQTGGSRPARRLTFCRPPKSKQKPASPGGGHSCRSGSVVPADGGADKGRSAPLRGSNCTYASGCLLITLQLIKFGAVRSARACWIERRPLLPLYEAPPLSAAGRPQTLKCPRQECPPPGERPFLCLLSFGRAKESEAGGGAQRPRSCGFPRGSRKPDVRPRG